MLTENQNLDNQGEDSMTPNNNIFIICSKIISITVTDYGEISSGQAWIWPPSISNNGNGEWQISLKADRHGSTDVANDFINWCITGNQGPASNCMVSYGSYSDTSPGKLNFAFGLSITFIIDGGTASVTVFVGQGHNYYNATNNWWFGSPSLNFVSSANGYLLTLKDNITLQVSDGGKYQPDSFELS